MVQQHHPQSSKQLYETPGRVITSSWYRRTHIDLALASSPYTDLEAIDPWTHPESKAYSLNPDSNSREQHSTSGRPVHSKALVSKFVAQDELTKGQMKCLDQSLRVSKNSRNRMKRVEAPIKGTGR